LDYRIILVFFYLLGGELLRVVEEVRITRKVLGSFNFTFIALIPNSNKNVTCDEFRPISLCNYVYKIIAKVLAVRLKKLLLDVILEEKFGFLERRQIHEEVGFSWASLHTTILRKLPTMVTKLHLSYKTCSLYVRLILIHVGFSLPFVNWIMDCVSSVSYAILVNGSVSTFFKPSRNL
jgi:hypothetical protein